MLHYKTGPTNLSTMAWKFLSHSLVMSLLVAVACGFHVNCCRIPPQVMIGIISPVLPNFTCETANDERHINNRIE